VETICEGVETEGQVRFLRRIGCTKLQGYYYSKPITLDEIIQRSQQGTYLGYENQAESA
jgi:EAL domain-containing protein (putative c-di-GMP-specific phosphodiesterase class I)